MNTDALSTTISTNTMRSIPPEFLPTFFIEFSLCLLYTVFMLILMRNKERFFRTSFFKLFCGSGFAGMWMIEAHWLITLLMKTAIEKQDDVLIYFAQVIDGSATISNTLSKFILVVNRFSVLDSFKSPTDTKWSNRKIFLLIFAQFTFPLLPHCYFLTRPLNFKDGYFDALDFATGSIYRGVTGAFYAIYAALAIVITLVSMVKLQKLWRENTIFSVALYKQQRTLTTFTLITTALHVLFSAHQFVWTYAYLDSSRPVLVVIRALRPYIFDGTVFVDPLILFALSKQVRMAFYGRFIKNRKSKHTSNFSASVNPI